MKSTILTILLSTLALCSSAEEHPFTVGTYNIDGLPKKILLFTVNPDGPKKEGTIKIANKLHQANWDIVGLNEDFNYHKQLLSVLQDKYSFATWRGKAGLTNLDSLRIKTDGLGMMWKKNISVSGEEWTQWCVYSGYWKDDNDGMARKGFRHYYARMPWGMTLSVYILHADAGATARAAAARKKQFTQLLGKVVKDSLNVPKVIMGDYNSVYSFDELKSYFIDKLNSQEHLSASDVMIEKLNNGIYPKCVYSDSTQYCAKDEVIDHIVYVNDDRSDWHLKAQSYTLVKSFTNDDGTQLSDHYPVCAELVAVKENKSQGEKYPGVKEQNQKNAKDKKRTRTRKQVRNKKKSSTGKRVVNNTKRRTVKR